MVEELLAAVRIHVVLCDRLREKDIKCKKKVINANVAVTLLEQRPEKKFRL